MVSIIIPVYNGEKTLPGCVESVLPALAAEDEILLINDGSQDETEAICQRYAAKNSQIRYFYQKNQGPSVARNLGFRHAQGDLIVFVDGDDVVESQPFFKALEWARSAPGNVDLFASDFYRTSRAGCIYDRVFQIEETAQPIYDCAYLGKFLRQPECYWNVWRYIFRREFLLEQGLSFPEGYHCAEDLTFVTHAFLKAKQVSFFHLPYYHYIINDGATLTRRYTISRISQLLTMLEVTEKNLEEAAAFPYRREIQRKLSLEFLTNLPLYWEIERAERPDAKALFTRDLTVLARSDLPLHRCVTLFTKLFGVPAAAYCLLLAKKLRRKRRERQYQSYERQHRAETG